MTNKYNELELLAKSHSIEFTDLGNGHVQLKGHGTLVNYWPESKNKTVHVKNGETIKHCSAWDAVRICMTSGKPGLRPKLKNISKNGPSFDLFPITTNPSGLRNFYNGKIPPWEFDEFIICESDRLRILANEMEN